MGNNGLQLYHYWVTVFPHPNFMVSSVANTLTGRFFCDCRMREPASFLNCLEVIAEQIKYFVSVDRESHDN